AGGTLQADLSITKTDGVTSYAPGGTLSYTVVAANTGLSSVFGAVVTDAKPAGIASWSWACTGATGGAAGCTPAASSAANFSDTVDLPVGATITYTVTANVAAGATGNLVNTACVAPPAGVTDTNAANDCSIDTDTPTVFSLGNRIFLDNGAGGGTANDGMQNGTELGIAGVGVSLFVDADMNGAPDTPGSPVATVVTD